MPSYDVNVNSHHHRKRCAVPECPNKYSTNSKIRYFSFPANIEKRKKWMALINNPIINEMGIKRVIHGYTVCSRHFETEQCQTVDKRKLLSNQFPKLFLPNRPQLLLEPTNKENDIEFIDLDEKKPEIISPLSFIFKSVKTYSNDFLTEVCRICLKSIDSSNKIQLIDENLLKLSEVLPEITLNFYPNPSVCRKCLKLLELSYEFKQISSKTENYLRNFIKESSGPRPTDLVIYRGQSDDVQDIEKILAAVDEQKCHTEKQKQIIDGKETKDNHQVGFEQSQEGKTDYKEFHRFTLKAMMKEHKGAPPFLCELCGRMLATMESYSTHHKNHRMRAKQRICEICGKLTSLATFSKHKTTHRKCKCCGKLCLTFREFRQHSMEHQTDSSQCHICGIEISTKKDLTIHLRTVHFQNYLKCPNCPKKFRTLYGYQEHQKIIHAKLSYQCNICGKSMKYEKSLKKHMKLAHENTARYRCKICGKMVKYQESLLIHIRNYHENKGQHYCVICQRSFWTKQKLMAHRKSKHSEIQY